MICCLQEGAELLLFTDRHLEPEGELNRLIMRGVCRLFPIHSAPSIKVDNALILCDVDLENFASAHMLRLALAVHRSPDNPLVFLLRDRNHHSESQARALGASDTIDGVEGLDSALMHLLAKYPFLNTHQSCVPAEAKMAVEGLLDPRIWNKPGDYNDMIDTGAQAVLDAVEAKGIHHWMDEVWSYDDRTYQHCLLVAGMSAAFGSSLGFSRGDKILLTTAGLVHDVGKAFVPIEILNKETALDAAELANIRRHPMIGYAILKEHGVRNTDVLGCVRSHHEMLDGSGYPAGLTGPALPDLVKMITICDVFSALVERRAYKEPMPSEAAFDYLKENRGYFDPALVRAFEPCFKAA